MKIIGFCNENATTIQTQVKCLSHFRNLWDAPIAMVWTEEYSYFYSMYILFWLKSKCPYNIERVATTDVDKLYMGPGKVIVVIKLNVPTGICNFVEDTFCITGPCKGNPLVTSGFPNKGRMTRGSGVSFGVNKLLNNSRVTSDLRCHDAHLTSLQCNVTIYGLYRFQLQLASSKNRKQLKILLWNLSLGECFPTLWNIQVMTQFAHN